MANPEDKQMKMQWITVDGRTVPLVLPQIWDPDKEDWVVTSTENPLQVDAQLTGSIVEHVLAEKMVVSAGSNVRTSHIRHGAKEASIYVHRYENGTLASGDFSTQVIERTSDGYQEAGAGTERLSSDFTDHNRAYIERFKTRTPNLQVGVINKSINSAEFTVYLSAVI